MSTSERMMNETFEVMDTQTAPNSNLPGLKTSDQNSGMKISDLYIGNISSGITTLQSDDTILLASQLIRTDPMLPGFCIIDNGELLGVVTKNHLHVKLSSKYGYSLYSNKEIELIMCKDFLCVDFFTTIDIVVKIAMQRDPEKIYDFITVTKGKKYCGIVTVKDLLEKSMLMDVVNTLRAQPFSASSGNQQTAGLLEIPGTSPDRSFVLDFDIDNFAAYNEAYGSESGDIVMERLSQILSRNIPKEFFAGQSGEDNYIATAPLLEAEKICRQVVEQFEEMMPNFYTQTDLTRGYVLAESGRGIEGVYPLMSLTVAGIPGACFLDFSGDPAMKKKNRNIQVLHEHFRSKNEFP